MIFLCNRCNECFSSAAFLKKHHKKKIPCDLICKMCDKKCTDRFAYSRHIKKCEPKEYTKDEIEKLKNNSTNDKDCNNNNVSDESKSNTVSGNLLQNTTAPVDKPVDTDSNICVNINDIDTFISNVINDVKRQRIDSNLVYLIKLNDKKVYKIGKTDRTIRERIQDYPSDAELYLTEKVSNNTEVEKVIKEVFKNIFKQRRDLGFEYFEGDINNMCRVFKNITSRYPL